MPAPRLPRRRRLALLCLLLCLGLGGGLWRWHLRSLRFQPRLVSAAPAEGGAWEAGMARMRVELPFNTQTELHFVVPLDAHGNPRPSASRILFWAPYLGAANALRSRGLPPAALEYARRSGWTVFSLTIDSPAPGDCSPHPYYTHYESGWWQAVFASQEWLQRKYGLAPGKLLLGGESAGGGMAERLAVAFPERILAAAWSGGSGYAPIPPGFSVPLFALNSWGCYGATPTWELRRQAAAAGAQLLWAEVPPYLNGKTVEHHAPSRLTEERKWRFLQAILDLQEPATGKIPPPEQWPESLPMPDGLTAHFPCRELREAWQELPLEINHALRQEWPTRPLPGPRPSPHRANALFFYQEAGECFLQDAAEILRREGCQAYFLPLPDNGNDSPLCAEPEGGAGKREPTPPWQEAALAEMLSRGREALHVPQPLLLLGNGPGAQPALLAAETLCAEREKEGEGPALHLALMDPILTLEEEERLQALPCPKRVFLSQLDFSPLEAEQTTCLPQADSLEILWLDFLHAAAKLPQ